MITGAYIVIVILGVLVILLAAAWQTERKSRKFFSRMYTKALVKLAEPEIEDRFVAFENPRSKTITVVDKRHGNIIHTIKRTNPPKTD